MANIYIRLRELFSWDKSILFLYTLCIANLLIMHYCIAIPYSGIPLDTTHQIDNLLGVSFDIMTLYAISYIITRKRPMTSFVITFVISLLWALCNVVYARFFHSYITISSVSDGSSVFDPIVFNSAIHGFKWQDGAFIIIAILFVVVYHKHHTSLPKNKPARILAFHVAFFCFALFLDLFSHTFFCLAQKKYRYITYYTHRIYDRHIDSYNALSIPVSTTFYRGSMRVLLQEAYDRLRGDITLDDLQKKQIQSIIAESRNTVNTVPHNRCATHHIIFIIVESYMAFTSNMEINGKEITPFLNSLRNDSAVYYNGHVKPCITLGESADGQFIYMTGILPLRSVITLSKAQHCTLPGLPKVFAQMGMDSRMVIPTPATTWKQATMCKCYGFNHLYSIDDYHKPHDASLTDEQLFEHALNYDTQYKDKPSLSVVLTMSMHHPYNKLIDSSFDVVSESITDELRCYLNACHYTDNCIAKYFEQLKKIGTYDKSLIVIVADHHVHSADFGEGITDDIPLYIINSHLSSNHFWHGSCNQTDIYTTLLDLFNVNTQWYGMGHSLLTPHYSNSLSSTKWESSELILKSNYFEEK